MTIKATTGSSSIRKILGLSTMTILLLVLYLAIIPGNKPNDSLNIFNNSRQLDLIKRKGGGGGSRGGGGGGSRGSSSGGGRGSTSSLGSRPKNSISRGTSSGGSTVSSTKGSGVNSRPPNSETYSSYISTPLRGFSSSSTTLFGTPKDKALKSSPIRPYTPPPSYYGGAKYAQVKPGQFVQGYSITKNPSAPSVFYRPELGSRWIPVVYYPIYPYPYWAYGQGEQFEGVYIQDEYPFVLKKCYSELRNITMVAIPQTADGGDEKSRAGSPRIIPLYNNTDLFGNGKNVTVSSYNNGTVFIDPCGSTATAMNDKEKGCGALFELDLVKGVAKQGNVTISAEKEGENPQTGVEFVLIYGRDKVTLRTETIANTQCRTNGPFITYIVVFSVLGVIIICGGVLLTWYCCVKKKKKSWAELCCGCWWCCYPRFGKSSKSQNNNNNAPNYGFK
ncbi:hypothetical protein H4219_005048 [Mycoemilia scoparia]|uniref:Uncharacterized protein n=1 Tax=Mycoemilia scoparia TaxID=417184 RepID=A0A9W7ZUC8_9FUNG|nr:hypothetical protein H4219_005048 [Mycoemilia scoparia]